MPSLMGRTATRSASLVPPTAGSNRQPTASESNKQQVDLMWCPTDENPSDLLTKAIASPSKFEKFQSVLLGECEMKREVVTQEALAVKDKNGVAHCFLIRRRGGD